ncbi:Hypothetical_protein [Hexamita inflata]|uniref:Hypothetical_protein n=1 Tax=Hexamita inflata TaxID=28002 RepID=A0ABP1GY27_9EUKA
MSILFHLLLRQICPHSWCDVMATRPDLVRNPFWQMMSPSMKSIGCPVLLVLYFPLNSISKMLLLFWMQNVFSELTIGKQLKTFICLLKTFTFQNIGSNN